MKSEGHGRSESWIFGLLLVIALGIVAALVETVQVRQADWAPVDVRQSKGIERSAAAPLARETARRPLQAIGASDALLRDAAERAGRVAGLVEWRVDSRGSRHRVSGRLAPKGIPVFPERVFQFLYDGQGRFLESQGTASSDPSLHGEWLAGKTWDGKEVPVYREKAWRGKGERIWWWPVGAETPRAAWRTFEDGRFVITDARDGVVLGRRPGGSGPGDGQVLVNAGKR